MIYNCIREFTKIMKFRIKLNSSKFEFEDLRPCVYCVDYSGLQFQGNRDIEISQKKSLSKKVMEKKIYTITKFNR